MTSRPRIAIVAPGEMGAGVGARLTQNGAVVVTLLTGRSEASVQRAQAAGMEGVLPGDLSAVDLILSIVPPGEAVALAEQLAPVLGRAADKPIYVDCNAISPATVERVAAIVTASGARFVDAGIIGGAPRGTGYTPAIYASGPDAQALAPLGALGLDIRVMDGPVGQASALKMAYAALSKGIQAVGISAMLGAIAAGISEPFLKELENTQADTLAYLRERTPSVFARAYRWVAEMEEIGAFLGGGGEQLFNGAARQFERLAKDQKAGGVDEAAIIALLRGEP
jgi:L-threonate 2-dehydrogenase